MTTVTHKLEPGQTEIRGAIDARHELIVPDWGLDQLQGLGDEPPAPTPLAWKGTGLMAAGMTADGARPVVDEDWDFTPDEPELDDDEPDDEVYEWVTDPTDWDIEEVEAVGDVVPKAPPLQYQGTGLMAAGMTADGTRPVVDEDWEFTPDEPKLDDDEPDDEVFEWITDPTDWDIEEVEALGDVVPKAPPLQYQGTGLMAAGMTADGTGSASSTHPTPEDDDWALESLGLEDATEGEPEDQLEDD